MAQTQKATLKILTIPLKKCNALQLFVGKSVIVCDYSLEKV